MKLFKIFITLLLLIGFYTPSYAAVDDIKLISCGVFNDEEKKDDNKTEEEEPDCE